MADVTAGLNNISATATLVGAAMETAGHYGQAKFLDLVEGDAGKKLAGLFYLIAVIGALITSASGGSYRYTLYLLVGPPLFFFLVTQRADSQGASWKFGQEDYGVARRDEALADIVPTQNYRVSLFFRAWDKLVSDMIQGFIELTELTSRESNLNFIAKSDKVFGSLTANTNDPKLIEFVNATLVNHCTRYFHYKLFLSNPRIPEGRKTAVREALASMNGTHNKVIQLSTNHPGLKEWLQEVAGLNEDALTCDEAWRVGIKAFRAVSAETFAGMVVKMGNFDRQTESQERRIQGRFAAKTVGAPQSIEQGGEDEARMTAMINEIAARMLVKHLKTTNPDLAATSLTDLALPTAPGASQVDTRETIRTMRYLTANDEYQYKGELIMGAVTMPYIQGAILYFLAVTFPFWAMMMVIPGRHTAMLLWMSLWLWAKMWDLGFAVVMMIDNVLHALLPHGQEMTNARVEDPNEALKIIFQTDPAYSAHNYYNLLSCCMLSIPFVCGFLVHKGGSDILEGVQGTFRDFPSRFGTTMAAFQRSMQSQHDASRVMKMREKAFADNAYAGMMTDSAVQQPLSAYLAWSAIKGTLGPGQSILVGDLKKKFAEMSVPSSQLAGIFSGLDLAGKVTMAEIDTRINYNMKTAVAKHQLNMAALAYKEGKTAEAITLATLAIASNYNAHDWRDALALPFGDWQKYEISKRQTPGTTSLYNSLFGLVKGLFSKGDNGGK